MASNEVRIIGGLWRGRKLRFAGGGELRPTLGRVRETLFNWLAPSLAGSHCLDLYAGSGALGFEALSRGAASVTFVERNRRSAAALRNAIDAFGTPDAQLRQESAERFLARESQRFDIVFFDPPFDDPAALKLLDRLRAGEAMNEGGLIYVERPVRSGLPYADALIKQSRAGDCVFGLLPTAREPGLQDT